MFSLISIKRRFTSALFLSLYSSVASFGFSVCFSKPSWDQDCKNFGSWGRGSYPLLPLVYWSDLWLRYGRCSLPRSYRSYLPERPRSSRRSRWYRWSRLCSLWEDRLPSFDLCLSRLRLLSHDVDYALDSFIHPWYTTLTAGNLVITLFVLSSCYT